MELTSSPTTRQRSSSQQISHVPMPCWCHLERVSSTGSVCPTHTAPLFQMLVLIYSSRHSSSQNNRHIRAEKPASHYLPTNGYLSSLHRIQFLHPRRPGSSGLYRNRNLPLYGRLLARRRSGPFHVQCRGFPAVYQRDRHGLRNSHNLGIQFHFESDLAGACAGVY